MPGKITREKGQHALVGLPIKREKHGLDPAALAAVRGETKKGGRRKHRKTRRRKTRRGGGYY